MKRLIITHVLILVVLMLVCGCTTTSTTAPPTTPAATTASTGITTTTSTVTVVTTLTSITYKTQTYEFMVEVYTAWDWEYITGGVYFYADGGNWTTLILSSEIDTTPTLSELEQNENSFIDTFITWLSQEKGYSEVEVSDHFTTASLSGDYTSSELHAEFTCNLNETEMWGYLYSIYADGRHYQIVSMCVLDRIYADDCLWESNQFYWTFSPYPAP